MRDKILILLFLVTLSMGTIGQGNNGMGSGPPNPPPSFCQIHPNHPSCINAVQVPLSDWYWEIGLMLSFSGFLYFKYFHLKKSNV